VPQHPKHFIDIATDCDEWETVSHTDHNHQQSSSWEYFFSTILTKVMDILALKTMYSLSILLTDNDAVHVLNRDFRGQDKPTNVLSFPPGDASPLPDGSVFLGDLAFAYTVIADEAAFDEKTFLNHMTHLTIHGILHLLDYDHEADDEAEIMEELEINILKHFNIRNPYTLS
jgi:probable rRNA maturation factor